ncbi:MAG: BMP family lipoprotein [Chitinophagales bacterium]
MKKSQKMLPVFLVLVMVLGIFLTGCSREEKTVKENQKAKLKVGLVLDIGEGEKNPFDISTLEGLKRAQKDFKDSIETSSYKPDAKTSRDQLARKLASQKYDLVICAGTFFTNVLPKIAQDYPGTKFVLIDDQLPEGKTKPNVMCISFREQESGFLAGVAAASSTQTGKIGFVGGMKCPPLDRFEAGYKAGARYVNPDTEVLVQYIANNAIGFANPEQGKAVASQEIADGADVIYQVSGASGEGVIAAAAAAKKLAIGTDSDQSLTADSKVRSSILMSTTKNLDEAVYKSVEILVKGEYKGQSIQMGLKEKGLGYAENHYYPELLGDVKVKLDEVSAKIINGEIDVTK